MIMSPESDHKNEVLELNTECEMESMTSQATTDPTECSADYYATSHTETVQITNVGILKTNQNTAGKEIAADWYRSKRYQLS